MSYLTNGSFFDSVKIQKEFSISLLSSSALFSSSLSPLSNSTTVVYIPKEAAFFGFLSAIVICLVGIVGNLLTMAALFRYSARLNSHATTKFVINLAFTDLLFCALVLPFTSGRYLNRRWVFGSFFCRLYPMFYYGQVATSLMLITMITINRLVLISYNKRYSKIYTNRNVNLMILFCWVFSYGIMVIPFFEIWGRFGYQTNTFSCTVLRDSKGRSPKKFIFCLGFFLPMTVIVFCYSIIFFHVRQQAKSANKLRTSKRDLRLTLLISVVFGAFFVCFLPLFVGNVLIPDHRYPYFHVVASIFAWLNSCINPFIYFAMNPRYRSAFKRLFGLKRTRSYGINTATNNNHQYNVNSQKGNQEISIETIDTLNNITTSNSNSFTNKFRWSSSNRRTTTTTTTKNQQQSDNTDKTNNHQNGTNNSNNSQSIRASSLRRLSSLSSS